jgi:hypothetical protein
MLAVSSSLEIGLSAMAGSRGSIYPFSEQSPPIPQNGIPFFGG